MPKKNKRKYVYITHILEDVKDEDVSVVFGANTTLQRAKKSCEAFWAELNSTYPMQQSLASDWEVVNLDDEVHYANGPFMIQRFELDVGGNL